MPALPTLRTVRGLHSGDRSFFVEPWPGELSQFEAQEGLWTRQGEPEHVGQPATPSSPPLLAEEGACLLKKLKNQMAKQNRTE